MTDSDLFQVANAYFGIQGSEKGKIASKRTVTVSP